MQLIKRFTSLALLSACLITLQGCLAAAVVGGAAVATKVATDPRSAGRQLDDETLEERIAYRLAQDPQLSEQARINTVAYGGKVLLIGQAYDDDVKGVAKSLAAGVDGVEVVYNELRIGQKIGLAQISQDSWITAKVKSQLLTNNSVKATDVKVITENREVFLMGNLSAAQANAATDVARKVSGVRRVVKVITYPSY